MMYQYVGKLLMYFRMLYSTFQFFTVHSTGQVCASDGLYFVSQALYNVHPWDWTVLCSGCTVHPWAKVAFIVLGGQYCLLICVGIKQSIKCT